MKKGLNIAFDPIDGKFIKTIAAILDTTCIDLVKDAVFHRVMQLADDCKDDVLKGIYKRYIQERMETK